MTSRAPVFVASCAAAVLTLAGTASASTSNANYSSAPGVEGYCAFTAYVTYSYTSGPTASLTISLTNTTNAAIGGYATALALSGATGITGISYQSCNDADFGALSGPVSANPFGDFAAGSSTSNSWLGGGNPSVGIGVGNTAVFNFLLAGSQSALNTLDASNVLLPSTGQGFAVRFRGLSNGGSDKVLGFVIPGPGGLALLAVAAAGRGRRRR